MNKAQKLKNKKRYIGNPFTVAFLPVLASAGLTLGATSLTVKSNNTSEIYKAHEIKINDPSVEHPGWKLTVKKDGVVVTSARKGEQVVFQAERTSTNKNTNADNPSAVKINTTTYALDDELKATVTIPFVEKMTVDLVFPEPKATKNVTFDLDYDPQDPERPQRTIVPVVLGEKVEKPHDPERPGYVFDGWYENGSPFNFDTQITRDHYLVAQWDEAPATKKHPINIEYETGSNWTFKTYNSDGQEIDKAAKGEKVTFKAIHDTKTYLHFPYAFKLKPSDPSLGSGMTYYLTKSTWDLFEVTIDIPYELDMDAVLMFKNDETFTLSFNSKGGPAVGSQTVYAGRTIEKPIPTWLGHEFKNWYTDEACSEGKEFDFSQPIFADTTLYAKWNTKQYTITFKDGDGTVLSNDKYDYGTTPVYDVAKHGTPTLKPTQQESYTWTGWTTPISPVTDDATYTPSFAPTTTAYTVTFNSDGGTDIPAQSVLYGYPILDKPLPTKTGGNKFVGWFYDNGGTEEEWQFGEQGTIVTGNVTLKAHWIGQTYTATFYNYDGQELEKQTKLEYGTKPSCSKTPTHWDKHKVFDHWSPSLAGITEDTNYVAVFRDDVAKHTVRLDSKGGTSVLKEFEVYDGQTIPSSSRPADPTKYGYIFDDWYYDNGGTKTKFVFGETQVTSDLVLYADWKADKFTITFVNDDGSAVGEPQQVEYGTLPTPPATPVKPNPTDPNKPYTFKGWSPTLQYVTGPATYKAVYDEETYYQRTVTFDTDGAEEYIAPVTVDSGSNITKPTVTKKGKTLVGWFDAEGNEFKFDDTGKSVDPVTSNLALKAKWETSKYTVTFKNYDGTVIESDQWDYDATPSCSTIPGREPSEHKIYTFVGWDSPIIPVTKDTVYTAVYTDEAEPLTVKFNTNEGSAVPDVYVRYGHKLFESQITTPTKSGYEFKGWYTDNTLQTPWDFNTVITENNTTLYAKWDYPEVDPSKLDLQYNYYGTNKYSINAYTDDKVNIILPSHYKPESGIEADIDAISAGVFKSATTSVKKVKLPETIKMIKSAAFEGTQLNEINLENVEEIDPQAFNNTQLTSVNISNKTTKIGIGAFSGNLKLKSVTFDGERTKEDPLVINYTCFMGCTALETVVLPRYVDLSWGIFANANTNLTTITYKGTIEEWKAIYEESGNKPTSQGSNALSNCNIRYVYCEADEQTWDKQNP